MLLPITLFSAAIPGVCAEERTAVAEIADAIEQRYVIEAVAERSAAIVRADSAAGKLDKHCDDPAKFAEFLTAYLRESTADKHFYVEFTGGAADNTGDQGDDWLAEWRSQAAYNAFGVRRVERLPGNIGYLALSSFYEIEPAKAALKSAFTLLSSSDAMILDLRNNGGGSPETAWPIEWTFRTAGSDVLRTVECRVCDEKPLAEADFDWPRYGSDKPLVILVNKRSFSAAEAVAYGLQAEGRAIVVGEPSGGGAHMLGKSVPISGGWSLGVPEARPVNQRTGGNWEGDGVVPDFRIASDEALGYAVEYLKKDISE